jgi:hypothetical protein
LLELGWSIFAFGEPRSQQRQLVKRLRGRRRVRVSRTISCLLGKYDPDIKGEVQGEVLAWLV